MNYLTTDRHLGTTLPAGDWALAGFDLTLLGFAACFALIARKLRRKWAVADAAQPPATNFERMRHEPAE